MLYSQTYYDPGYAPSYGVDPSLFFLVLIVLGFFALLIWLANYEFPKSAPAKAEKSLRDEIEGIFQDLRDNAVTYNRAEVIPTLDKARDKVTDALAKRNLS